MLDRIIFCWDLIFTMMTDTNRWGGLGPGCWEGWSLSLLCTLSFAVLPDWLVLELPDQIYQFSSYTCSFSFSSHRRHLRVHPDHRHLEHQPKPGEILTKLSAYAVEILRLGYSSSVEYNGYYYPAPPPRVYWFGREQRELACAGWYLVFSICLLRWWCQIGMRRPILTLHSNHYITL